MPWISDLVTQLENEGVGTFGVSIFASTAAAIPMLASGLATLQVISTSGSGSELFQNDTTRPAFRFPGAQIVARATDYLTAEAKANAAYAALFKVHNQFINSGWYQWVRPEQEPFDLGKDDRGQQRVAFNVTGKYNPR